MKKIIVAILAFLYISTSIGVTIDMHYCMGELADWGIGHNDTKACGKCGMDKADSKDNGCCRDEHRFFKDNSDQKTTEGNIPVFLVQAAALPSSFIELPVAIFSSVTEVNPLSHAPPRTNGVAVYIRNCVFRI